MKEDTEQAVALALSAATGTNSSVRAPAQNSLHDVAGAEGEAEEGATGVKPSTEEKAEAKAAEIKAKAKAKAKGKGKAASGTDPENPPPNRKPADPQLVLLAQAKLVKQQRSDVLTECSEIKNLTATHAEWKFASTPAEMNTLQKEMDKLQASNLV